MHYAADLSAGSQAHLAHDALTQHDVPDRPGGSTPRWSSEGLTLHPALMRPTTPLTSLASTRNMCAIVAYVADVLLELAVGCKGTVPKIAVESKPPLLSCGVVHR